MSHRKPTQPPRARVAVVSVLGALATSLLLGLGACSNGLTTQEAYAACEDLQKTVGDETTFDDCVACFENCADCEPAGTSPETYRCPGDPPATTAASTGASSSSGG